MPESSMKITLSTYMSGSTVTFKSQNDSPQKLLRDDELFHRRKLINYLPPPSYHAEDNPTLHNINSSFRQGDRIRPRPSILTETLPTYEEAMKSINKSQLDNLNRSYEEDSFEGIPQRGSVSRKRKCYNTANCTENNRKFRFRKSHSSDGCLENQNKSLGVHNCEIKSNNLEVKTLLKVCKSLDVPPNINTSSHLTVSNEKLTKSFSADKSSHTTQFGEVPKFIRKTSIPKETTQSLRYSQKNGSLSKTLRNNQANSFDHYNRYKTKLKVRSRSEDLYNIDSNCESSRFLDPPDYTKITNKHQSYNEFWSSTKTDNSFKTEYYMKQKSNNTNTNDGISITTDSRENNNYEDNSGNCATEVTECSENDDPIFIGCFPCSSASSDSRFTEKSTAVCIDNSVDSNLNHVVKSQDNTKSDHKEDEEMINFIMRDFLEFDAENKCSQNEIEVSNKTNETEVSKNIRMSSNTKKLRRQSAVDDLDITCIDAINRIYEEKSLENRHQQYMPVKESIWCSRDKIDPEPNYLVDNSEATSAVDLLIGGVVECGQGNTVGNERNHGNHFRVTHGLPNFSCSDHKGENRKMNSDCTDVLNIMSATNSKISPQKCPNMFSHQESDASNTVKTYWQQPCMKYSKEGIIETDKSCLESAACSEACHPTPKPSFCHFTAKTLQTSASNDDSSVVHERCKDCFCSSVVTGDIQSCEGGFVAIPRRNQSHEGGSGTCPARGSSLAVAVEGKDYPASLAGDPSTERGEVLLFTRG